MKEKLYYQDSYIREFEAQIKTCERYKEGYIVTLTQTAFYPGGGGQPHDTGYLNEVRVMEVFEREDEICHVTEEPLEVESVVKGSIDFERRLDYMQQHTAEHILAGVLYTQYKANNVGFHLNDEYVTADFDIEFTEKEVRDIEECVNAVIYENVRVSDTIYTQEEVKDMTYRAKIDLEEEVRLVTIEGYDQCACCGTQVKSTGEIGMVKIIGADRHRGGMRFTLLAGKRVLRDYRDKLELIKEISNMFSTKPENTIEVIKKLQQELSDTKQMLVKRTNEVLETKVEAYLNSCERVVIVEEELEAGEQRKLITTLTEKSDKLYVFLHGESPTRYIIGCSKCDVRPLVKELNEAFGGKGGGNASLCQGSVVAGKEKILNYIKQKNHLISDQ